MWKSKRCKTGLSMRMYVEQKRAFFARCCIVTTSLWTTIKCTLLSSFVVIFVTSKVFINDNLPVFSFIENILNTKLNSYRLVSKTPDTTSKETWKFVLKYTNFYLLTEKYLINYQVRCFVLRKHWQKDIQT